jgi:hypothetical protein
MSQPFANLNPLLQAYVDAWNTKALGHFRKRAREKIAEQVAKGNNQFGVQVDNRASDYAGIDKARNVIRVQFTQPALRLALRIVEEELRRSIDEATVKRSGKLLNSVAVFVARGPTSGFSHVPSLSEFAMQPGDIIAVTPTAPYSAIVNHYVTQINSRKKTAKSGLTKVRQTKRGPVGGKPRRGIGFMGRAAARIRSAIGQNRRGLGSIAVSAGFSHAVAAAAQVKVVGNKVNNGLPCIFITYRYLKNATVIPV